MTAGADEVDGAKAVAMLRAAIEGIKARGQSDVGDKTLLDALVPLTDTLEHQLAAGADAGTALEAAASSAREAAAATQSMIAKRGRASYTGERSIGSVDAGATAVGVILTEISRAWNESTPTEQEATQ
jgi:dihydroxyacetone kinase/dihydroxyacetone kinase-like protein